MPSAVSILPALLLGCLLALESCGGTAPAAIPGSAATPPAPAATADGIPETNSPWIDSTLAGMNLEERVGQVVMAVGYGHFVNRESEEFERLARLVRDRRLGGIIMTHGDVLETAAITNALQRLARVPLLFSGDYERGLAMRVRRGTIFPDAMAIGATRDTFLAHAAGRAIAEEMRAVGVHQNYAPVADVNRNPLNPVINTRSFGEDPELVAEMAGAFVRGTIEGGGVPTAKHFPGHGDTGTDSHLELPLLPFTRARLDSVELLPFRRTIERGVLSVMIGHLSVPALEPSPGIPTTLSGNVVKGLLREELGFRGLVVTDAMDMRGVAAGFSVGDRAVQSFLAGADVVLMPGDDEVALAALVAAARTGEIPAARLEESVRRVLALKEMLGLHRLRTVDVEAAASIVGARAHRALAKEIARQAVTLLRNENGIIPLDPEDSAGTIVIALHGTVQHWATVHRPGHPWPVEHAWGNLEAQMRRRGLAGDFVNLAPDDDRRVMAAVLERAARAERIIVPVFVEVRTGSGAISLPGQFEGFVEKLAALRKPTVVLTLGTPYLAERFAWADGLLCAYADAEPSVEAAAEALAGESPVRGRLPVTVSSRFPFGAGVILDRSVLREGTPEEAGFTRTGLVALEEIVRAGIRDSVYPCAQLAVVRNGVLAVDRAYGTFTYERTAREIDRNTIFDLASLTKVIATTTAVMKLYDEGRIRLDTRVSDVLPAFRGGRKGEVTVEQILTHTSGLPAFLKLIDIVGTREAALDTILRTPLLWGPGDTTVYSDLGMIILAEAVRAVAGVPIDRYLQENFFGPLHMTRTMFVPPPLLREQAAPTEVDSGWRKALVRGTVHDERAALLGGVAGHAGLFSTAGDLAVFMTMVMEGGIYGGRRYLKDSTIALFTRRRSPRSTRALGWDTKSPTGSTAGDRFSPGAYGHTGFTGTSIWVDPDRRMCVILLTNRVHPTRANTRIAKVRPAVHNAAVSAISADPPQEERNHP